MTTTAATTTATAATQIRFFRVSQHQFRLHRIHPCDQKRKIRKKKVVLPSRSTKKKPTPPSFRFRSSSSFPQLWLQSIKLDSNKQYVSRLLRGYRRLKKLFKVRDPSLSVRYPRIPRIALFDLFPSASLFPPRERGIEEITARQIFARVSHTHTHTVGCSRARGGARSSVFFGAAEPRGACDGEGRESAYQRIGACAPIDSRARRLARETVRREAPRRVERESPSCRERRDTSTWLDSDSCSDKSVGQNREGAIREDDAAGS